MLLLRFDPGPRVGATVSDALPHNEGLPIWLIDDGSESATRERLARLTAKYERVQALPHHEANQDKGAAILTGIRTARRAGLTHALTLDADGQHPSVFIPAFIAAARRRPEAMILGRPVFSADAAALRVHGRKVSNFWANLETVWAKVGDSLFGMRVYPIGDLIAVMGSTHWMRRFDFDTEAAVRLVWRGVASPR